MPINDDTTKRQTAYKDPRPRLLCWLRESNAHGLAYTPVFFPEGEDPEVGEWIRAAWMDEQDG